MAFRLPLQKHTALIVGVCFLILDRYFKVLALSEAYYGNKYFEFALSGNTRAALSLSFGFDVVWIAAPICVALLFWLIRSWIKNKNEAASLVFIFLGAVSNLYDRVAYGYVIDYLGLLSLTILNLADLMIVGGALYLTWSELWKKAK